MLTVKEANQKLIESAINKLISTGTYRDIDDIMKKNPSLEEFCFNNKLNFIVHSFSTQFTNKDYIELLKQMKLNMKKQTINQEQIKETNIGNQVFVDFNNGDENKTLVGIESVNNQGNSQNTFEHEMKYEKREADFRKLAEIDPSKLNSEQLLVYQTVLQEPENDKYQIYFDENGQMTNTVVDENKNYFSVEIIDGKPQFTNQNSSKEQSNQNTQSLAKQKVLTLNNGHHNISAAFANTLILSFIIGSFFGIIFLAIYTKIMH